MSDLRHSGGFEIGFRREGIRFRIFQCVPDRSNGHELDGRDEVVHMARITFTARLVREVSERVRAVAGDAFTIDTTGTRTDGGQFYTDGGKVHDWRGPEGARHAVAWMIGGALGTVTAGGPELPVDDARYFVEVLKAAGAGSVPRQQNADHWETVGRHHAATTVQR